jgi:hypothetical protein
MVLFGSWSAGIGSSPRLFGWAPADGAVAAGRAGALHGQGQWLPFKATCRPPSDRRTGGGRLGNTRPGDGGRTVGQPGRPYSGAAF